MNSYSPPKWKYLIKIHFMQMLHSWVLSSNGFAESCFLEQSTYSQASWIAFFPQICTPDLVVFLACSNQRLKERLLKRAEQQGRPDDNLKATQRRLMNFKQNAVPLVKYFQEKGLIVTVSLLIYTSENCCGYIWFLWFSFCFKIG